MAVVAAAPAAVIGSDCAVSHSVKSNNYVPSDSVRKWANILKPNLESIAFFGDLCTSQPKTFKWNYLESNIVLHAHWITADEFWTNHNLHSERLEFMSIFGECQWNAFILFLSFRTSIECLSNSIEFLCGDSSVFQFQNLKYSTSLNRNSISCQKQFGILAYAKYNHSCCSIQSSSPTLSLSLSA